MAHNPMTLTRKGTVLSAFNYVTYGFKARDDETNQEVFISITCWQSRYPGLVPNVGEKIDLIYARNVCTNGNSFLMARPG